MTSVNPSRQHTEQGDLRRIGLELEFAGIDLETAARIIQQLYGGDIVHNHRYEIVVEQTELGDFRVELDARILRKMANRDILSKWGIDFDEQSIRDSIEQVLDRIAMTVIPLEIVMPPVPITELDKLEPVREELEANKAEGTGVSFMNAFGLHMNIESPSLSQTSILQYLRSFLIIYPWLLEKLHIDISRRISPFIDHFPTAYVEKILNPEYDPDQKTMVSDYLHHNPTRNRPLDLLPILAMLEPELVQSAIRDEKNKPRPAFHYRLPNSRIDDPEWSFTEEWNRWQIIENLQSDPEMIRRLSKLYLFNRGSTLLSFRREWATTISILLDLDDETQT
ncbi:MAG: amidoligase family protein [Balneolaceae bacterium]|nr:amidoligase family protein [Balneolaceae bacterium]